MVDAIRPIQVPTIEPTRTVDPASTESAGADRTAASAFGDAIGSALETMSTADANAAAASQAAATGDVASIGDYMIAATEAQLTTELTVAVRNRALEAFNDIMRMQI